MVLSVTFDPLFRDPDRGGTQQPLLLDSLDLTSFSSRELRTATPTDQLPLKAVYRDAVLGLRYLALSTHARSAPNRPQVEFRRLQAKFASAAERERFVDAVGALVPAKPAVEAEPVSAAAAPAPAAAPPAAKRPKVAPPPVPPAPSAKPVKAAAKKKAPTPRSRKKQAQPTSPAPPPPAHVPPTLDSPSPSPLAPNPHPHPASSAPRLPPHLSALLPHLATASTSTASQLLAALAPHEFAHLLQDALLEDGFEQLVERVQRTLMGG